MSLKYLLRFLVFCVAVALVLGLTMFSIAATQAGSNWFIRWIIETNDVPVQIEVVEGRLLDSVELQGIHYSDERHDLRIDRLQIDWHPAALFNALVDIERLALEGVRYRANETDTETETSAGVLEIPVIAVPDLPVAVQLRQFQLTRAEWQRGTEQVIRMAAAASMEITEQSASLQIDEFAVTGHVFQGRVQIAGVPSPELQMDLDWQGPIGEQPARAALNLSGLQQALEISVRSKGGLDGRIDGRLDLLNAPYSIVLDGDVAGESLATISDSLTFNRSLSFDISGNRDELALSLATGVEVNNVSLAVDADIELAVPGTKHEHPAMHVEWQTRPNKPSATLYALKGVGDFSLLADVLKLDHVVEGPGRAHLVGAVNLDSRQLDLSLDWEALALPVDESARLVSEQGRSSITGTPADLNVHLQSVYEYRPDGERAGLSAALPVQVDAWLNLDADVPELEVKGMVETPLPTMLSQDMIDLETLVFSVKGTTERLRLELGTLPDFSNKTNYYFQLNADAILADRQRASIDWYVSDLKNREKAVAGSGSVEFDGGRLTVAHQSQPPFQTDLQGSLSDINSADPGLSLELAWSDIGLASVMPVAVSSEQGKVSVRGPLSSLVIGANSQLNIAPVGPVNVDLDAGVADALLDIENLTLQVLGGVLTASGQADFNHAPTADIVLEGSQLDFSRINPDLKSSLNLASSITMEQVDDKPRLTVDIASVTGTWRGKALQGNARIARHGQQIDVSQLQLALEQNRIDMTLQWDERLSGEAELALQDLSSFSSGLAGRLDGSLGFSGQRFLPQVTGKLVGSNLYFNDIRMASMDARLNLDLEPGSRSDIDIKAQTFSFRETLFDTLSITGKGVTEQHNISLSADGDTMRLTAELEAGLRGNDWTGQLNGLDLYENAVGEWQLAEPVAYHWQVDRQAFAVDDLCLLQDTASVCLHAVGDAAQQLRAQLRLQGLPLSLVNRWLPTTLSVAGQADGTVNVDKTSRDWLLTMDLKGQSASLDIGFAGDNEQLALQTATLTGAITSQTRQLELTFTAQDYFEFRLDTRYASDETAPLVADLKMRFDDIRWLEKVEPALSGTRGHIDLELQASGSRRQPAVTGRFALKDGVISVVPLGLQVQQVEGRVFTDDATRDVNLDAFVASQDKRITLAGAISLDEDEDYPYQLSLDGKQFPIVRTADVTMDFSPALKVNGNMERHRIRGSITIPKLDVLFSSLPESAVAVSPDTVIIQSKKPGAVHIEEGSAASDFVQDNLDIDISVILGSDIHVRGFGLDTRLSGELNIKKEYAAAQPLVQGQVSLNEGSYRAYGQNLEIESGRILFAGPVDNPAINVRAFRPNLDVKAGVNVTGSIRQPKLTLFSDPARSESDMLSYIITGRPLSGASGSEASVIARAALSLGVQESSMLTGQIAEMFNLDEFSVGAGDTVESTSLNASKKITPDLTFRTAFNPFDRMWNFMLNYRLTENWSVQTESGLTQGADIIYSIESNKFKELYRKFLNILKF